MSKRWYPINIIGSNLYDILLMYGTEFSSGSALLTQTLNNLAIESVQDGSMPGHALSKMYENFGILVQANKLPGQQFSIFDTGSVQNSYREMLKMLFLANTEGSTPDAMARIGQAINGVSPYIVEPINSYPGWVLSNYTGSVYGTVTNANAKEQFVIVEPGFGRFRNIIPVVTGSVLPNGSAVSLSYSVLGTNTILGSREFYESGALMYFFHASGSVSDTVETFISQQVSRLLPANVQPLIRFSEDFVLWKPVGLLQDTMVSGSNVFAINHNGWIYNANPTGWNGSQYVTDVIQLPT
jgi:hypothetical protein